MKRKCESPNRKNRKTKNQKFILFLNFAFICVFILIQILVFFYLIQSSTKLSEWISVILRVVSLLVVFHIINTHEKTGFKLIWIIFVLATPILGGVCYLVFHLQASTLKFRRDVSQLEFATRSNLFITQDDNEKSAYELAINDVSQFSTNIFYLQQTVGFPVFNQSESEYLTPGEEFFARLLQELKKAEKYIFIEYFIIDSGLMWNSVLEILSEKASKGVDVRILYDDVGTILLQSSSFPKQMERLGIKCVRFNKFKPFFLVSMNHRDHRKITVIDGKVAFTGGINIADEYINTKERFGYWKDSAVMVKGKAAWSFAVMFLQLWNFACKRREPFSYFLPDISSDCDNADISVNGAGYVQPFADSPTDKENVSEHVYLHMIHNAKNYLYIATPYFVVDDSFVSALILAAKSGVDVRIILPYKWDKFFVKQISKSFYNELVSGGVRVFEYLPGFIHSKVFLCDDVAAVVGSVNLDYRSLYHHFECATCLYKTSSLLEIKSDFLQMFRECDEVSEEKTKKNFFARLLQSVLKIVAPWF